MKRISRIILISFILVTLVCTNAFASKPITVTLDGKNIAFEDAQPTIIDGRTMVPLRAIFEALGATVSWDEKTQTVKAVKPGYEVISTIGSYMINVNGKETKMDIAPLIIESRTLFPARFVAEAFDCVVDWNGDSQTVIIKSVKVPEVKDDAVAYPQDVAKAVYNATMLMGTDVLYDENKTITYGQLSKAAITLIKCENVTDYGGLDSEAPFNNMYVRDFYVVGRDVLGAEFVTEANIAKEATVEDSTKVMAYAMNKFSGGKVTVTKDELIPTVKRDSKITHKDFAQMVTQLEDKYPILQKIEITKRNTIAYVPIKIQKDLSKYPSNSAKFRAIFEEIPNKMYEKEFYTTRKTQEPVLNYDFARDFRSTLLGIISPWVDIAAKKGVELKITYYPTLALDNGNGYTMRTRFDVIDVSGEVMFKDVFNAPSTRKFVKGDSFYCDLLNNEPVLDIDMSHEKMTVSKILSIQ